MRYKARINISFTITITNSHRHNGTLQFRAHKDHSTTYGGHRDREQALDPDPTKEYSRCSIVPHDRPDDFSPQVRMPPVLLEQTTQVKMLSPCFRTTAQRACILAGSLPSNSLERMFYTSCMISELLISPPPPLLQHSHPWWHVQYHPHLETTHEWTDSSDAHIQPLLPGTGSGPLQ